MVIRPVAGDPRALASAVKKVVWAADPQLPVTRIRPMEQVLSASLSQRRFTLLVLGLFAGAALVLAAVGISGIVAYSAAQRTHEIGVRMALGAQRGDVQRMVVGQGLRLALGAIAVGIPSALAASRLVGSLLYGVLPTNAATYAAAALTVVSQALLASWLPAWRASRIDPMVALREQ